MLYRSTHCLCRGGAAVKNLAHSASFHSRERIAPSKPGIKHLGRVIEPIEALLPPEAITCRLAFPEPLLTREALAEVVRQLTAKVCVELERQGQRARRL